MSFYEPKIRLKLRRTKIIATVGLASNTEAMLEKLILAGVNVLRLNFSHSTHEKHLEVIERARKVSKSLGKHVAILGDLCGPKIRVGNFDGGQITLWEGKLVKVVTDNVAGKEGLIPSQYPHLVKDVKEGQKILLDDGKLELEITNIESDTVLICRVVRGGTLKNKKGMNLPETDLSVPAVTEKDEKDLEFCLKHNLDYVALSFVRTAKEISDLKSKITEMTFSLHSSETSFIAPTRIIAKIEKPEALDDIENILSESDGIMIARGDLGVELPLQKVPTIQKELIKMARQHNKPVIVATQMLESMLEHARPTRSDISDIATAVSQSTDAVMLSGETAAGKYPVEAVNTMDSIIREIESHQFSCGKFGKLESDVSIYPLHNALARACTMLSKDMEIRALNVLTQSGSGARFMSASRPNAPVIAYCYNQKVLNQMLLYWGVVPVLMEKDLEWNDFMSFVDKSVKKMKIASSKDYVLALSSSIQKKAVKNFNSIVLFQVT